MGQRLDVEDGEGLFECLDRSAEHLVNYGLGRILRGDVLMQIDMRLAAIGLQGRAQILIAVEAEPLGGLDHHRLGDLRLARHLFQLRRGVAVAAQQDFGDARLCRRQFRQQHTDSRSDRPRVKSRVHSLPRVNRSTSIASMMIMPVASNW